MSRRLHALVRCLLPRALRLRQGAAMEEAFDAALRQARAEGRAAVVRLWCREALDVVRTAVALRVRRSVTLRPVDGSTRRRAVGRAAAAAFAADTHAAWRTLVRRPSFTLFAALTMALGIGAATSVFSALEAVFLNPLPYANGERLVALFESSGSESLFLSPGGESVERWRAQQDLFESVEQVGLATRRLTGADGATTVNAALIGPGFHALTGLEPLFGRRFTAEEMKGDGARVVLVGHAFWRARLGARRDVLGESLQLDGEPWTIVGVMPPNAVLPTLDTSARDLWLPYSESRQQRPGSVAALLRPGVELEDVSARFERLWAQGQAENPEDPPNRGVALLVGQQRGAALREPLNLLGFAVTLLVLIACINVANLLLGAAGEQRADTAVRVALGASRGNIFRQVLMQGLLLSLLGGAGGLALTRLALAAVTALRPANLAGLDGAQINGTVLAFSAAITALAGLLAALVPAVSAAGRGGAAGLRRRTIGAHGRGGRRLRWSLISGEVALSFVLLVGSLLVATDLWRLQRLDVGFDAAEVAVLSIGLPPWKYPEPAARQQVWDGIAAQLERLDGIERLAQASGVPPRTGITFGAVEIDGLPASEEPAVLFGPRVAAGYFATIGQRIVAGRAFTADEVRDGADLIILGEETARSYFGDRDPLGARLRIGDDGDWLTVIGLASDVAMLGPSSRSVLQQYRPLAQGERTDLHRTLILRAGGGTDAADLLPAARQIALAAEGDVLFTNLATGDGLMRETLGQQRFVGGLLLTFAVLALLLAAVGLYGVIFQLVSRRTRELGIRMALGAHAGRIRAHVLLDGAVAVGAGVAAGLPLVWACRRLLTGTYLFEDISAGAGVYLTAAAVLTLSALLAAYGPTRRATRIDPVSAMRDG